MEHPAKELVGVLSLLIFVSGCGDKLISERATRTWQAEGVVKCSYSCIRWTCEDSLDWDDDGDRECGLHHTDCSGHQRAMLQFTEIERIYETDTGQGEKSHRKQLHIEDRILQRLDRCR